MADMTEPPSPAGHSEYSETPGDERLEITLQQRGDGPVLYNPGQEDRCGGELLSDQAGAQLPTAKWETEMAEDQDMSFSQAGSQQLEGSQETRESHCTVCDQPIRSMSLRCCGSCAGNIPAFSDHLKFQTAFSD